MNINPNVLFSLFSDHTCPPSPHIGEFQVEWYPFTSSQMGQKSARKAKQLLSPGKQRFLKPDE